MNSLASGAGYSLPSTELSSTSQVSCTRSLQGVGARPALSVTSVVWKGQLDLPIAFFLVDKDGMGKKTLTGRSYDSKLSNLLKWSFKEMKLNFFPKSGCRLALSNV